VTLALLSVACISVSVFIYYFSTATVVTCTRVSYMHTCQLYVYCLSCCLLCTGLLAVSARLSLYTRRYHCTQNVVWTAHSNGWSPEISQHTQTQYFYSPGCLLSLPYLSVVSSRFISQEDYTAYIHYEDVSSQTENVYNHVIA
jgi:hypothetical protein